MASAPRVSEPAALVAQMGAPLDADRYDWSRAAEFPLSAEERFLLTYAAQVEWGTEGTFASLNVSKDPVVKQFLEIWLAHEVVHADLIDRLLSTTGDRVEPKHVSFGQRFAQQRGRWINWLATRVIGRDFFGVQMTWGAVNELTTQRFYMVMRERTRNPLLREILRDVIAQESLHYTFYRASAVEQLRDNPRGQRIVRWAMEHLWSPVGAGLHSDEDVERLMLGTFANRPDQVKQMDAAINRIPGMEDVNLLATCLAA